MLRHDEQAEATTPTLAAAGSAADVRVTAEEFARAVTRFQARREQAAQRMEGTVAIGEAVHELGLEATPEEILAEVQAERAAQAQRADQAMLRPATRRTPRILAASAAGVLLLAGTGLFFTRAVQTTNPQMMPASKIQPPPQSSFVTMTAAPTMLVQDNTSGKPILRTLAEVPDNVPVNCVLEMTETRAAFADFSHGDSDTTWSLIKHGGRVYVRGWIANMSPKALRSSTIYIYVRKGMVPSGFAPTPVTLPINGFETNPVYGADDTIVAEHVLTDPVHFAERW